ncbi:hypothetical protein XENTR_v10008225 [Xenopus tropicalis]|uniref:Ankyrin repeat domain-containing protein SOWAHA n=2 Tax=Xenopus tropicalis TaxID=8364 RepID=F7B3H6_XENTR|nr:ankyrin repeat domain-containing protein SOWAHA [Xenopus tropicalis]KAE8614577.1 hypothetical protein XENTR_v10008225 [Xenopus tropicalis]|eukprot:XP_002935307.1 PREDICTED: ankyrin repeat domain-containing protein SOWAHA [Xenopus tropicalis]
MAVTQEHVLHFMLEQRGKVRNSDLLKKFKPLVDCPDPEKKAQNRARFKTFVNTVAVVRDEAEGKMVVLKKKYMHLVTEKEGTSGQEDEPIQAMDGVTQPVSVIQHQPKQSATEEPAPSTQRRHSTQLLLQGSSEDLRQQDKHCTIQSDTGESDASAEMTDVTDPREKPSSDESNEIESETESKRETVFAIVARMDNAGPVPVPKSWVDAQPKEAAQKPYMLPLRCPQPTGGTENDPEGRSTKETPAVNAAVEEVARPVQSRSPRVSRRQYDETATKSPHLKRSSKMQKVSEDQKYSDVVPLDPSEHKWLVTSTNGRWNHTLYGLLLSDGELVGKRDFISGFTALHWAAKTGNNEMMKILIDSVSKNNMKLNVNVKSFGGYTPLHIAAIHDRTDFITSLVRYYHANVNLRDHSGKKPYQYLKKDSPQKIRILLNDPHAISIEQAVPMKRNSKVATSILGTTSAFLGVLSEDAALQDLTRNVKKSGSLNKFFNVPSVQKKKLKARESLPIFMLLNEEPEEEIEETMGKRRPVSEYFSH